MRRFSLATLIAIYFLILVGGVVRTTGSGMGCPDWPKCFDRWVPPSSESELPSDYASQLLDKRKSKNDRLVSFLEMSGLDSYFLTSTEKKDMNETVYFNVTRAWIEYLNRIVGVLVGAFVLFNFFITLKYLKRNVRLVAVSLFVLLLVVFQGWLGSLVVSSNLLPGMISIHMIPVVFIVFALLIQYSSTFKKVDIVENVNLPLFLTCALLIIQIFLGIRVREVVDIVGEPMDHNFDFFGLDFIGFKFYLHRSFSFLVLIVHVWLWFSIKKNDLFNRFKVISNVVVGLLIFEILIGIILSYFKLPPFFKPLHLLSAIILIGCEFYILVNNNPKLFLLNLRNIR